MTRDKRSLSATDQREAARRNRDKLRHERNTLLSLLSHVWPSHLTEPTRSRLRPDTDVPGILCIHAPAGKLAWSLSSEDAMSLFSHLEPRECAWDGASNTERQERLDGLCVDATAWASATVPRLTTPEAHTPKAKRPAKCAPDPHS